MNLRLILGLGTLGSLLTALVVGGLRQWSLKHILDIPNERSSHSKPTPSGGGIGIVAVTLLLFVLGLILTPVDSDRGAYLIYVPLVLLIAALGYWDDRYQLSAKLRLLLQATAALIFTLGVGAVTQLELPYLGTISLGLLALLVNLFWITGLTNVFNFMDGIDGIAGTQALVAGAAWTILLLSQQQTDAALLTLLISAGSLGFLYWNRPPARIFMGDTGSTFLGFSFAALVLLANRQQTDAAWLVSGVLFVGVFAFDSALTILRRLLKRENILTAHRSHLYQRLVRLGYSHRSVTSAYGGLMLVCALCGFAYFKGGEAVRLAALLIALLLCLGLFGVTTWLEQRPPRTAESYPESVPQEH